MSRTNPLKKKRRQAKKTLLIFGEGFNEEMFIKHLKLLYSYRSNTAITIKKGKGGDAPNIVIDADKILGSFNRKVVVFDNDKSKLEMTKARQEARNRKIELIENTPCLEKVLLLILQTALKEKNSACYKKEFERKFINHKKRGERQEYIRLFPKKLLEVKRVIIKELDDLILIMEGK